MHYRHFKSHSRQRSPSMRTLRVESLEERSLLAVVNVTPHAETVAASSADDVAVWIHPTDTSQSTIIGTAKSSSRALRVYDLEGNQLQSVESGRINNVDLRYNFPLGGQATTLVVGSNRSNDSIAIYRVNPQSRLLENVAARTITTQIDIYGAAMYVSPVTGKYFAFVSSESGAVQQWELFDNGAGRVDATLVRSFSVGSVSEGLVADDLLGHLYVGQESVGIWKYAAEPNGGNARSRVDSAGQLDADIEGLSIYYADAGTGYLLASSQGNDQFAVYRREGNNPYLGNFQLIAGNGIDRVSNTDGIDVTNVSLGSQFPSGMFVAQDSDDNFKMARWDAIANAFGGTLTVSTSWDPRLIGAGTAENQAPQVNAGADQTIALTATATLDATVSDDGPLANVTSLWTLSSGPGVVTFANANMIDTTATFSAPGTYVLRLTADDGTTEAMDELTIVVTSADDPPTPPGNLETLAFQDGVSHGGAYNGTRDTWIAGNKKTANYGTSNILMGDGSPDRGILMSWELGDLPAGAVVQSASITLHVTETSKHSYLLYALKRPWNETEANWLQAGSGLPWGTVGTNNTSDRNTTMIGTFTARAKGASTIELNAEGIALIQAWIDNPQSNFGILIANYTNASNGFTVASSDAATIAMRPKLSVTISATTIPQTIPTAPDLEETRSEERTSLRRFRRFLAR